MSPFRAGGALLGLILAASVAVAQGIPSPSPVVVTTPDGGLPVTVGAQRVAVEATGPGGSSVSVAGTVELGSSTTASLVAPTCTFPSTPPVVTLTTTAQTVPATPYAGRTQLVVLNLSTVHSVWCCLGPACTPTSVAAYIIPATSHQEFTVRDTTVLRCRAATATADVNIQEAACE